MHVDPDQSFVHPMRSFIQQSCTLSKVQYLYFADRDVFKITRFHDMTTQVPAS